MPPGHRFTPILCVTVALSGACGGRASDRDRSSVLDPVADDVAPPVEELPSSLDVLELRVGATNAALTGLPSCDASARSRNSPPPENYERRIKVNFQSAEMILELCEATAYSINTSTSPKDLYDSELERIGDAYRQLRVTRTAECVPDALALTLDLSPEHGSHLVYGDERSDCPEPALQRRGFLSGLDQFYGVLLSMAK